MKRFLLASAAAAVISTTAGAADLPVKYPVKAIPEPGFSWTGFYIGGNAGYGWGGGSDDYYKNNCIKTPPSKTCTHKSITSYSLSGGGGGGLGGGGGGDPSGFVGGGQIGYNYQFQNNFVLGFETDIQGADLRGSTDWSPVQHPGAFNRETSIDYYGTIRARVGYAIDRFLPYVTGGLAYGKLGFSETFISSQNPVWNYAAADSSTKWGWTVGAGAEYAITNNWSVRAEYLYVNLGNMDYAFSVPNYDSYGYYKDARFGSIDGSFQTLRFAVNYRF